MAAISGIVKDATGTPCAALVRVIRRADMSLVGQVFSDASTGAYSVTTADTTPHIVERYVAPVGDVNFAKNLLLMHMDDTGLTDVMGHAVTVNGSGARSSAQSKFGGYSFYANGTTTFLSVAVNSSTFRMPGDFVIDAWVYVPSAGTMMCVADTRTGGTYTDFVLDISTTGKVDFVTAGGSGVRLTTAESIPYAQWVYVSVVRISGVMYAYINTTRSATSVAYAGTIAAATTSLQIGKSKDPLWSSGYVDELRIATYAPYSGATIAVPTAPSLDYLIGAPTENVQVFDNVIPV